LKTIYLHVGNFKTGTSAIQKFCSDNRSQLLNCGYDYIKSARPSSNTTNHGKLPLSLVRQCKAYVPQWYDDKDTFLEVSKAVIEEIENSSCDNIIISSEEFYRIPGCRTAVVGAAVTELRQVFSECHVKVIMYVRKPLDMVKSWYNEVNKSNLPARRFTDFFYYINASLLLPQWNAQFWRDCFGNDSLIVEEYGLSGAEHIRRFIELVGIKERITIPPSMLEVNPGRNEGSLESDRISRIMLLDNESDREKFLTSFVFQNAFNERKLQDKIDTINRDFSRFCQEENLLFSNVKFGVSDLRDHEEKVNRSSVTPSIFRQKLAKLRASKLTQILKNIRHVLQR
jgi:hypothetical protein